ncbi:hypothetical protein [Hyphomonas jannaschiana]|uniref:Uncharacterized protein n=1 Tax=Hyphomonas jannaschiana VP2 TaxID=1280952 RepID=A0A059FFB1_9PROT|nr:hypothetical protein [Hyphomonas jannaschiana]KCZ89188.1 hypothetical protein HJA_07822 [Hyphomonas jannaschiana VP2]
MSTSDYVDESLIVRRSGAWIAFQLVFMTFAGLVCATVSFLSFTRGAFGLIELLFSSLLFALLLAVIVKLILRLQNSDTIVEMVPAGIILPDGEMLGWDKIDSIKGASMFGLPKVVLKRGSMIVLNPNEVSYGKVAQFLRFAKVHAPPHLTASYEL